LDRIVLEPGRPDAGMGYVNIGRPAKGPANGLREYQRILTWIGDTFHHPASPRDLRSLAIRHGHSGSDAYRGRDAISDDPVCHVDIAPESVGLSDNSKPIDHQVHCRGIDSERAVGARRRSVVRCVVAAPENRDVGVLLIDNYPDETIV